eukprot:TRINITY_DN9717_c0_g1_i1.p1 TRINITY_DN9717_c0_g1~~TRINITY_DN9717_c0_g1_i1.p1  ORF type:complete len:302 (+),score=94.50 TRINITY_DN9717_c0_g1_i1:128-907(+)
MQTKRRLLAHHLTAKNLANEVLNKRKREETEEDDEDEKEEEIAAPAPKKEKKSFKDPNFYLEPTPQNVHSEAGLSINAGETLNSKDVVMDLMGDDTSTIKNDRLVRKWDRKKKKFVMVKGGVDVNDKKSMKNESGQKIKEADKGKIYENWTRRTHMSIPKVGDIEDKSTSHSAKNLNLFKFKHQQNRKTNEKVRSELKSADQIQKERKEKAKKENRGKRQRRAPNDPSPHKRGKGAAPPRSKKISVGKKPNFSKNKRRK